jgi:NTP pyrophosphatase (non-canonical NTP hydrolase)
MHISEYQSEVDRWIKTVGVAYFSETTNALILAEEVGEVARLMARIYGEQSFREKVSPEEQKNMLADELADVLWVVACIANQTNIDLQQAVEKNFEKKNLRDQTRHQNNPKLINKDSL